MKRETDKEAEEGENNPLPEERIQVNEPNIRHFKLFSVLREKVKIA